MSKFYKKDLYLSTPRDSISNEVSATRASLDREYQNYLIDELEELNVSTNRLVKVELKNIYRLSHVADPTEEISLTSFVSSAFSTPIPEDITLDSSKNEELSTVDSTEQQDRIEIEYKYKT